MAQTDAAKRNGGGRAGWSTTTREWPAESTDVVRAGMEEERNGVLGAEVKLLTILTSLHES